MAVPAEVVPTIDELKRRGHRQRAIAKHLGVHWPTIYNVLKRNGAYANIPARAAGVVAQTPEHLRKHNDLD